MAPTLTVRFCHSANESRRPAAQTFPMGLQNGKSRTSLTDLAPTTPAPSGQMVWLKCSIKRSGRSGETSWLDRPFHSGFSPRLWVEANLGRHSANSGYAFIPAVDVSPTASMVSPSALLSITVLPDPHRITVTSTAKAGSTTIQVLVSGAQPKYRTALESGLVMSTATAKGNSYDKRDVVIRYLWCLGKGGRIMLARTPNAQTDKLTKPISAALIWYLKSWCHKLLRRAPSEISFLSQPRSQAWRVILGLTSQPFRKWRPRISQVSWRWHQLPCRDHLLEILRGVMRRKIS